MPLHVWIFSLTCLNLIAIFLNGMRMHGADLRRIDSLEAQLHAAQAEQARIRRQLADRDLNLRSSQKSYVVDLPAHMPSVRIYLN